jgi:ATP-dependent Lon protease
MSDAEKDGKKKRGKVPEGLAGLLHRKADGGSEPEPATDLPEDALIIVAVRALVLLPGMVLPIVAGRSRSVRGIHAAVQSEKPVGVLLQKDAEEDEPTPDGLHRIGTVAHILRYLTAPDGTHHVIVQGRARFRVIEFLRTDPFLVARVERMEEPGEEELPPEVQARFLNLKQKALEAVELLPQKPEDLDAAIANVSSPTMLTSLIATFLDIPPEEKQAILEADGIGARIDLVAEKLGKLVQVLKLSSELRSQTEGEMQKAQRDYFLREQLKTIQKELGETPSVELEELREKIAAAGMPAEVEKEAHKELARLERMPEASLEFGMVRTYLEWLIDIPWSRTTTDVIDVAGARAILDEDHYGLEKVKKRILEFLAVRKLKPKGKSPILCLVGPPGVGKTSLGQSVARAMGRKFVRVSLGGVHDEAEIRGHRRTYVGAMPGTIMQQIRRAGTKNPVFMLDELDKLTIGPHGDPSSALLEVLDPEQNFSFRDNYLNVPFDLSEVMFIGTANVKHAIPRPLLDRCEVIELTGYTAEEKLEIAKRYLVKRRREESGLDPSQLRIADAALREIIRSYTREAGVRDLERAIGAVARHVATRVAAGEVQSLSVGRKDLAEVLGPPQFESEVALRTSVPGVATGLAWTPLGGEILFVEASSMPGKGELILTGQLGDVMKESARAAITLVKANAKEIGIAEETFTTRDLHIHVPAGAIPKDGPSAGVAIYAALVSLLTGRLIRTDVAMTGEISLRGLVLPVGGIKDKVLAAHHAGIATVVLPARNRKDFEDIPANARENLRFVWAERVEDVVAATLESRRPRARSKRRHDGSHLPA